MFIFIFILPVLILGGETASCKLQKSERQRWGYITIREGAEMFFWSYLDKNYTHRPLVLWLQGGPGIASSGIGNFLEIGPKHMDETAREFAWTKNCSVVFVDSPVGTGFSYVWNQSRLVKTDVSAAKDLVAFLKGLYTKLTDLNNTPLYIFGESYGAKIAAEFALQLTAAIKKKEIYCNFKGLALGDPWLSPVTSVQNYASFLYANSFIDSMGLAPISSVADLIGKEMSLGHAENATNLFFHSMEPLVTKETNGVNFYNILEDGKNQFFKERNSVSTSILLHEKSKILNLSHIKGGDVIQELIQFMNGPIKKAIRLPQNATWTAQNNLVFNAMKGDFMRSAVDTVDKLLNETKLEIMVYNGQLDLIVPSIGTESWVRQLKWPGIAGWTKTKRQTLLAKNNSTTGYYKKFKNFSFYWILKAGHMVPLDAPSPAQDMLCSFLLEKC